MRRKYLNIVKERQNNSGRRKKNMAKRSERRDRWGENRLERSRKAPHIETIVKKNGRKRKRFAFLTLRMQTYFSLYFLLLILLPLLTLNSDTFTISPAL